MLQTSTNNLSELSFEQTDKLLEWVKLKTGMVFASRLMPWVLKQLDQVFQASGAANINLFLQDLIAGKKLLEAQILFDNLTVNETMFFRDKKYFDFIVQKMFPDIIQNNQSTRSLSVWVAAGSSGQEAYSILFAILENFPLVKGWNIQIYSTDLCTEVIKKAKEGKYEKHEISRGLDNALLERYFTPIDDRYFQVKQEYREMIKFSSSNLVQDFSGAVPAVDFISCRNVLIYFNDVTKADIIKRLAKKVKSRGYFILGQVDYINAKTPPDGFEYKWEGTFPYYHRLT